MNPDLINRSGDLASKALDEIDKYFDKSDRTDKDLKECLTALKVVEVHPRMRSARAREAANALRLAEQMGLSGPTLAKIFEEFTGVRIALPESTE